MALVLAWGISAALAAPVSGAPASSPPPFATAPAPAPAPVAAPSGPAPVVPSGAVPAGPPGTVVPEPPPVVSSNVAPPVVTPPVVTPPTTGMTAEQLLAAGRLLEAALEYEEAWRTSGSPADLMGAARAREAMGHRGHAESYLRELEVRGHGDKEVTRRLEQLEARLVTVRVAVTTPETTSDLEVRARYRGRAADARPDLVMHTPPARSRTAEVVTMLDPGTWEVWIEDEYYAESRTEVVVPTSGVAPVVQIEAMPRRPPYADARRMASPGLMLGVGIGLLAGGQVEVKRVLRRSDVECGGSGWPCRDLLSRGVSLRSAGAGILGASVGMVAAHLVLLSSKRKVRQAVWSAEAGLGMVGVIAGTVGVYFTARTYNNVDRELLWSDAALQAELKQATTGHTTAAFFLGLGAGMLVRSIGYLINTRGVFLRARRHRDARKEPFALAPGGAGGLLTARF